MHKKIFNFCCPTVEKDSNRIAIVENNEHVQMNLASNEWGILIINYDYKQKIYCFVQIVLYKWLEVNELEE